MNSLAPSSFIAIANNEKPSMNIPVVVDVSRATKPPTKDAIPTVIKTAKIEDIGEIVCKMEGPSPPRVETSADACQAPKNPTNPVAKTTIALRIQVFIGT